MNKNIQHPAEQLAQIMRRIYDCRLTTTSGGNLSIKDENGDVWITPGAIDKGTLTKEDMVCIKPDGTFIGRHKPSSEYPFHLKIYETRKELKAVLHAHPSALVAFSIVRRIPDTTLMPQVYLKCGKAGMAPYAMTGSHELGDRIAEVFREGHQVVMLENHGVVVGAKSLQEAFGKFETMEYSARTQIHGEMIGTPHGLGTEVLKKCRDAAVFEMESFEPGGYSAEEQAAREEVCSFAARAYRQGLITCVQGSFSRRVNERRFVITPMYKDRLYLNPGVLAAVEDGKKEADRDLDWMTAVHQAIYQKHPQVHSVIMCQPQHTMAFAVTDEPLDSKTIPESYIMMRDIPRIPGPAFLAEPEEIARAFNKSTPVVMVENDCLIVTGESMLNAFDRLEVTEYSAMSIIMSKNLGKIVPIDEKGLEDIRKGFCLE